MQSAIIGSQDFVYGICEIQNLIAVEGGFAAAGFGNVRSAKLGRKADQEPIEDCKGDLRAMLLRNPHYELKLSIVVSSTLSLCDLGARLTFPLANMYGNVLGWDLAWQSKGLKMLDVDATRWDSLGDDATVTIAS